MHKIKPIPIPPDANIAAAGIAKKLDQPLNLGIGTMPGHSYQPIDKETLTEGTQFLLNLLGLHPDKTTVIPAKGGGSGAISCGIAALRSLGYRPASAAFSHWDWTGYDSFCTAQGLEKHLLDTNSYLHEDPNTIVFLQTNRNADGTRLNLERAEAIIELNNRLKRPNFIDLPYFTASEEERAVLQLFAEKSEQPTIVAWSPTKIYQTFASRPGGVVFLLHPTSDHKKDLGWVGGVTARGTTGFDDATTRELWADLAHNQSDLTRRHQHYLEVVKIATKVWRANTPEWAQNYFDDTLYGGMFRLFPAEADTQAKMAAQNIVPVLMQSGDEYKVRVNLCGINKPDGSVLADADKKIAQFFDILKS